MFSSDPTDSVPRASVKGGDLGWWRTHNKNRRVTLTHLKVATNNHLRTDRRTAVMQVHWTRHLTSESQLTATRLDSTRIQATCAFPWCFHTPLRSFKSIIVTIQSPPPSYAWTWDHSPSFIQCSLVLSAPERHSRFPGLFHQAAAACPTNDKTRVSRKLQEWQHRHWILHSTHHVAIWPARFH